MAPSAAHCPPPKGDGLGGEGIVIKPASGEYSSVVLWMHGLGDSAMGWYQSMPGLNLQSTKFVLPTAPNRPISINGGMQVDQGDSAVKPPAVPLPLTPPTHAL